MRVLIVTSLFQPEPNHLKGLTFAKELQRRGHEVHVLTGFPNYPGGVVYPGYRIRWTMEESLEGVPITRAAMYPSHDRSGLRRAASYVSLGLSLALHLLTSRRRFDVCLVGLGPITLMWPALTVRRLQGTRIVADVQDIWPESVADSGMLSSRAAVGILDAVCRRAYRAADRVLVLSPGYKRALVARGVAAERVEVVYNWCDEGSASAEVEEPLPGVLEARTFNVVYAGNLGKLQGVDTILDTAARVMSTQENVRFVIVGDGVEAERLRARVQEEHLCNVRMVGRMPPRQAQAVLRRADLLLVHLDRRPLTQMGIPQKVQAYLAAGRPVLLAAEGDAADVVDRSGGGTTCAPNDSGAMAAAIEVFVRMDREERDRIGRRGLDFYQAQMSFQRGMDRVEGVFLDLREVAGRA